MTLITRWGMCANDHYSGAPRPEALFKFEADFLCLECFVQVVEDIALDTEREWRYDSAMDSRNDTNESPYGQ